MASAKPSCCQTKAIPKDVIPVLLLPLPETRNIRNLVRKINLVPMKWFWLVFWTYCTSFCSWSPWHEPSYLDEVPGKTATPKSVSGDPSHLPQSHSEWPDPSKPLSFSHLRKEPSQVPEDQFFICCSIQRCTKFSGCHPVKNTLNRVMATREFTGHPVSQAEKDWCKM